MAHVESFGPVLSQFVSFFIAFVSLMGFDPEEMKIIVETYCIEKSLAVDHCVSERKGTFQCHKGRLRIRE